MVNISYGYYKSAEGGELLKELMKMWCPVNRCALTSEPHAESGEQLLPDAGLISHQAPLPSATLCNTFRDKRFFLNTQVKAELVLEIDKEVKEMDFTQNISTVCL